MKTTTGVTSQYVQEQERIRLNASDICIILVSFLHSWIKLICFELLSLQHTRQTNLTASYLQAFYWFR